jgi:hypothetical protein
MIAVTYVNRSRVQALQPSLRRQSLHMRASHEYYPPIKLRAQENFLVKRFDSSLRTSQDTRPTYKSMNALGSHPIQHVPPVKSLHSFHHHYHLSSVRLFIPCIEQPVTDCPPALSARRPFQTLLNRRHAA